MALSRAQDDAGPVGALLAGATWQAADGRSPDGLIYYINLAIDSLDLRARSPEPR